MRICLLIYSKLNKHTRFTWIVIDFHPVLTSEIEYGYYNDTSRLLAHPRSWIIGHLVLSLLLEKLMMSLFVSIYPHNFGYIRFHSSLLEPYQDSTILGRIKQPPPPIELEDRREYEVAAILDAKIVCNKLY